MTKIFKYFLSYNDDICIIIMYISLANCCIPVSCNTVTNFLVKNDVKK